MLTVLFVYEYDLVALSKSDIAFRTVVFNECDQSDVFSLRKRKRKINSMRSPIKNICVIHKYGCP